MVDINFYCNKSKVNKKGLAPIVISIISNGERKQLPLMMKADPFDFELAMKSNHPNMIKTYCSTIESKINEHLNELLVSGFTPSSEELVSYLKECAIDGNKATSPKAKTPQQRKESYTLGEMFDEYIAIISKRRGIDMCDDVYNKYILAKNTFMAVNGFDNSTLCSCVTLEHVMKLEVELKQKEYKQSTIAGYLTKLKTYFIFAFNSGKISSQPFAAFHIKKGLSDEIKYLTQEELDRIRNREFHSERLRRVRDVLLFQAYTGLSYIDMAQLEPDDFKYNELGQIFIKKRREKTGIFFTAVLLKDAIEIAKRYDYKLPVLTNQKYNSYLKEIGDLCEIDKEIHSHMLRHTCAMYLLNNHVNIETVAKVLGHANTKLTRLYAHVLDETVFGDIKEMEEKLKPSIKIADPSSLWDVDMN